MKDLDKLWVGLVEDNKDPKKLGRVRVRVQGLFGDIETEDIPWSSPIKSLSARSFEVPAIGKIVSVIFPNDLLYESYYMFADHYNVNLAKKVSELEGDEYANFVALVFDHKTKIFSDDTNLTVDYKYNRMTIDNDNINMELKDNSKKLNLGTQKADQQAVLGNHWFDWMDKFINALLKPTALIGNAGAPILKPDLDRLMVEYQTIRETFVSKNVYIVDNNKVDKIEMKYNSPIMDDGLKLNESSIVKDSPMGEKLSDAIKEQKDKELEKVKNAMPTEAFEEDLVERRPNGLDEQNKTDDDIVFNTIYKEVSNGEEKEITKERYDDIKKTESQKTNIDSYEEVYEQSDADEIAFGFSLSAATWMNEDDIPYYDLEQSDTDNIAMDYDPNRAYIYTASDGSKYTDAGTEFKTTTGSFNSDQYKKYYLGGGLKEDDYRRAANRLGVDVATIKAVTYVESSGSGFRKSDNKPKILYESHIFGKLTGYKYNKVAPSVSTTTWDQGRVYYSLDQYNRLNLASNYDKNNAQKSASWGMFQILGLNHVQCGYNGVDEYVKSNYVSAGKHLDNFVTFLLKSKYTTERGKKMGFTSTMLGALQDKKWDNFAFYYNGPGYKKNNYDTKLRDAYYGFRK